MMTTHELAGSLRELGLSQVEAARLLEVSDRTMRRWVEDAAELPGPAEQALRAWLRLHRLGVAWRVDSISLNDPGPAEVTKAISAHRRDAIEKDDVMRRVSARG